MKFYNRNKELEQLARIRQRAFVDHSQLTVVTGRRRIGKTKLIMKSCDGTPTVYLFVSRNNEATLCRQFSGALRRALGCYVPDGITSFVPLFEQIMVMGKTAAFNLVIDEFQEFFNINPSVFSGMQDVWDRYKDTTRVNLVASGSVYTLMHRIFMDYKEPLYGRCDTIIHLRPFSTSALKEILCDYYPAYTNDDLLALFTITGGVPKYVELLMERGAFTVNDMIGCVTEENSIFLEEGTILLAQEFGKKYGNYFSILSAIASGRNTAPEIAQAVGEANIGGMLLRLEEDYEIISKKRPVVSKERSQNVRYQIRDNFLRFWFRYVTRYQNLIQMGLNDKLRDIVLADYPTYSGLVLEEWFRRKLREEGCYKDIGSWWNTTKGNKTDSREVDIVAIPVDGDAPVLVAEVKRQGKNFKPEWFEEKVEHLRDKILHGCKIESRLFTLNDM
ncbi:MAG: ATP-binding protein [Prevotellaceae bacterium]|nr:ATP-binding protein [Prevotellaceae bacterium]